MQQKRELPPPPGLDLLQARGPVALFLDFDGTLVDIAARPDAIVVPATLAAALRDLDRRLGGRLALVSGRAVSDIESYLGRLGLSCAGSHGIDRRTADGSPLDAQPLVFPADVGEALAGFAAREGFSLEDKPHGRALHYRSDPSLEEAGLAFARELADSHGLVVKRGKCVIELVHPGADKGGAVRAFMAHEPFAGAVPWFIGDDVTDEDGFAAVEEFAGAGILVGDREPTRAQFRLADPGQVHTWLGL